MPRRIPLVLFVWLSFLTFCGAAAADRPNIVFLLTDDQAPWAVGSWPGSQAKTPNLDRLAREGATLRNSFVTTPVCSPSRAALMTSRYGTQLGILDWINPREEPDHGLDPATVTWSEVLAGAGYSNGLIGKWHLGTADRFHPTRTGFETFFGFREGGARPKNPTLEVHGQPVRMSGLLTDLLANRAIEFLAQKREEPFCLCLHFRAPHAPWLPVAPEDWKPFENLDPKLPNPDYPKLDIERLKKVTREYLASVASVDRNVGKVLDALDDLGLSENTIVIHTSDHGYNMGHNGIWHKGNGHWITTDLGRLPRRDPRRHRPNLYDHSLRVPTFVRWPGVVEPGTVVERTVTNLDWYPTLLAMAGVEKPDGVRLLGRDFTPLLKNHPIEWDDDLYAEYSQRHYVQADLRCYRTPEWKLIRDFRNEGKDELYHLAIDPEETNNLIGSKDPSIQLAVRNLQGKLMLQLLRNGDPVVKTENE